MSLNNCKIGDVVIRTMYGVNIVMELKITNIKKNKIYCGGWKFNQTNGIEIDKDLTFPCSFIVPK